MHRWLLPHVVAPVYEQVTGRRPWSTLGRLRELQWRAPGELEVRAVESLRGLVAHARAEVPYYRDLFHRAGVRSEDVRAVEDLASLPVTTRADLREALPEGALAADMPASRRLLARTSGSTGQPFEFYLDRTDVDIRRGSYLFFREWAGAPPWYTRVLVAIPSFVPPHHRPPPWLTWGRRILLGERVEHLHTDHLTLPRVRARDLANFVMPFINYDLGDIAVIAPPCR